MGGFFFKSIIFQTSIFPNQWNAIELTAWALTGLIFSLILAILFLPLLVWEIQRRSPQFSKKHFFLSFLPVGTIVLLGVAVMIKQNSSHCFSPFSSFGINPSYSIEITDQVLDEWNQWDPILTRSRLEGKEILLGDYSVGIGECQNAVKIKWRNHSSRLVTVKELPEKESIIIPSGETDSYTFKAAGDFPYTLNGFPKIIHVGTSRENFPLHPSDLEGFCRRFAKEEARVMFRREVPQERASALFERAGLTIITDEGQGVYLVQWPSGSSLEQIQEILSQDLDYGNIFTDCSVSESDH